MTAARVCDVRSIQTRTEPETSYDLKPGAHKNKTVSSLRMILAKNVESWKSTMLLCWAGKLSPPLKTTCIGPSKQQNLWACTMPPI